MKGRKFDLLQNLPYELWIRCMELYVRDEPEGPLPLLAVSLSWERNLLQTPEIWTTVHLDGGPDERCRAETFFHLSKNVSIELVLSRRSGALDIALKHAHRIKILVFHSRTQVEYTSDDISLHSHKLAGSKFPHLDQIHVEPPQQDPVLIPLSLITACPVLVGIYGAYIQPDIVPIVSPSMKVVRVAITEESDLSMTSCNDLEVLHIRTPFYSANGSYSQLFDGSSTRLREFVLEFYASQEYLPYIRPVNPVKHAHPLYVQAFLPNTRHNIRVLRLTMPWCDVSLLFPFFSTLIALRELELNLDYSVVPLTPWNATSLPASDICHIRQLFLSAVTMGGLNFNRSNVARIIQLFARPDALEKLEELRLVFPRGKFWHVASMFDLLASAKGLKVLHILGYEPFDPGLRTTTIRLEHLKTLVISKERYLTYLEVPRLVCFECMESMAEKRSISRSLANGIETVMISFTIFFEWGQLIVTKNATAQPFPRLLVLRVIPQTWVCQIPTGFLNFPVLRIISFVRPDPLSPINHEESGCLNQFLLEILFSPESCPQLHTIRATNYPNWALAISMFYRRNSLKNVTPIASLWLPWYPQITILPIICRAICAALSDSIKDFLIAVEIDDVIRRRLDNYYL